MPYRIAVLMPSVIFCSSGPLSYTKIRSIYTPEERAEQTRVGIASVRTAMPTAQVILIEGGLERDLPGNLHSLADKYIYVGGNPAVRRIVDGPHKGHGETVQLLCAHAAARECNFRYYFKLSGRYRLSKRFNLGDWTGIRGSLVAKKYSLSCICTRLYGFSASFYSRWRLGLLKAIPLLRTGWAVEDVMPKVIGEISHLQLLGVDGNLAPYGVGAYE